MTDSKPTWKFQRRKVYAGTALVPVIALGILLMPGQERLRAAGPANTGHEQLDCAQCHTAADGTVRQQVQANVRNFVGLRAVGADFIHKEVGNVDCLACHQNNDDRHPVYRFNEPRFAEAREAIGPQSCVNCHVEHSGRRATVDPTFCVNCHVDTKIQQDPIVPTHANLIALEEWGSCLGCHDFHGNHVRTTPTRLEGLLPEVDIAEYLAGGRPIYGTEVRFPAKQERVLE